ncbi:exodeoxyribonuclease VII small subunit [Rubritalea tangerina]|uniref:Exodeoxyribonuclease 7 small subunit n=1 Tax=Rubritalea tangerina TaxID=430798 RepID=A0ABW4Z7Z6_9BACT
MPKKSSPSFEQAMSELDAIVEQMESDQLPLEELISHYERGAKLLNDCESTLGAAKKRLETIKNAGTKSSSTPTTRAQTNTPSSSDDDEIRLF